MTYSPVRVGALTAAALLSIAILATPPSGALAYRVARHFGLVATPAPATPGQPLAGFPLMSLLGAPAGIERHDGRGLILNVFATWCVACNDETPGLARTAVDLQRAGIDVVGIDQAESAARVRRFIAAYRLAYPVYIDTDQVTRTLLDARFIPTTVFVDRRGIVRYVYTGPLEARQLVAMARTYASQ